MYRYAGVGKDCLTKKSVGVRGGGVIWTAADPTASCSLRKSSNAHLMFWPAFVLFLMSFALAPPPQSRSRAHSTNLRPALTISTLGRRRSTSLGRSPDDTTTHSNAPLQPPPSMFAVIVSRCLQLLHLPPKHSIQWSTLSSPVSSTDEYVLPISASSQQTMFGDVFGEKELSKTHASTTWWQGHPSVCRFGKSMPHSHSCPRCRYMPPYCLS